MVLMLRQTDTVECVGYIVCCVKNMSKFQDKDLFSNSPPFLVHFIEGQRLIPDDEMR